MLIKDVLKNYYGFLLDPNPIRLVDLGLSVLWADRNVGTDNETAYGDYFKWGGIKPIQEEKITYDKDSSTLPLSNDIVNIKLGGFCRLPTKEELEELVNLPNEWVKNYKNSGHDGRVFTGNGNSIFIPAAGVWNNGNLNSIGFVCRLWSSSLDSRYPNCAWHLDFTSDYANIYNYNRDCGYSVRGVYPK